MSLFDNLEKVYRPLLSVSPCEICGRDVGHYGKTVHLPSGAPLVGLDSNEYDLCIGHAIYV